MGKSITCAFIGLGKMGRELCGRIDLFPDIFSQYRF